MTGRRIRFDPLKTASERPGLADEGGYSVRVWGLVFEGAEHGGGRRSRSAAFRRRASSAQRCWASMTTATLLGPDGLVDGFGDLAGEALLHLEAAGEGIDEAREFAEANDFAGGDVGDVGLAEEWEQVVLAHGVELDVLDDDHLVVLDVEERAVEDFVDVHAVALGEEGHRLLHALGGLEQAVAGGVLVVAAKEFGVDLLGGEFREIGFVLVGLALVGHNAFRAY